MASFFPPDFLSLFPFRPFPVLFLVPFGAFTHRFQGFIIFPFIATAELAAALF